MNKKYVFEHCGKVRAINNLYNNNVSIYRCLYTISQLIFKLIFVLQNRDTVPLMLEAHFSSYKYSKAQ